ncbi:6-phospho-3-hexuloisomerase [Bacillus sp. SB49]|uniref:6-phospho-3-hexuloisomerase n=1 Tax=Bacillus sp. SB49 TaxID=1071080 RepID=UPI000423C86A|nr:6-phospho-3-hexuloisomerase [Bacillus sp. SB49]QHT47919.1 6-phospho-3-hexuloisomerase [Bacillus sp. SB49]
MKTAGYLAEIMEELSQTVQQIPESKAEELVNQITASKKVFVTGAGRSGFMGKSFAMRMMHMGIDAYVVGETVTANLEPGDLLIVGSGSGETKTLVAIAEKAKHSGGKVAAVTISPESTIGQMADIVIPLPGMTKDQSAGSHSSIQPMGTLFEQTMLLFYDALILRFMEKKGLDSDKMYGKHANLE